MQNDDDNQQSKVWYLAKYYFFFLQKLDKFIMNEIANAKTNLAATNWEDESSKIQYINLASTEDLSSSFKSELAFMKLNVFAANNFQFLLNFVQQMNLMDTLKIVHPNFEAETNAFIEANVSKATDFFISIHEKWKQLNISHGKILSFK